MTMKRVHYAVLAIGILLGLFACSSENVNRGAAVIAPASEIVAAAAVKTLADDVWSSMLEQSTYLRLQEGLPIERFEDLTLEQHREDLARTAEFRRRLNDIDGSVLGGNDRITFEILAFELRDTGANDDDFWLRFDVTPYQAPYYFQFAQQAMSSFDIANKKAADRYLGLVSEYADMADHLLAKLDGQAKRGIYLPSPAVPSARATWMGIKAASLKVLNVADDRLNGLSDGERLGFTQSLQALIDTRIVSGFDALIGYLNDEYESLAPGQVGISQYPGGSEVYARLIAQETTLALTPVEIHERGKSAVAEISERMAAIREHVGFTGSASEFLDELKRNPNFIAKSVDELESRYWDYIKRIEPKLDSYFETPPNAAYGVKRLPLEAEPGMTYGYYTSPTMADPVGYYLYNGSNLQDRSLVWAGTLIYHELVPGHHFHSATQNENASLPSYRKKYSVTAFSEGWAEYAASLAIEMELYESPLELYGRYVAEMFLATRLVVDTGMNALGWTLQESHDYMRARVIQSDSEIESELLRYSTSIPAQALGYRLGYEHIWQLRRRAEQQLGDRFDIREFHEVVLFDGTKPLGVLEAKVDRYIATAE